MRIALISRAVFGLHGYGGMERHVRELARFLARAGGEPTIVTMPSEHAAAWNEPGVELQIIEAARLPLRGIPDRVIIIRIGRARWGRGCSTKTLMWCMRKVSPAGAMRHT
jgi:hypothetical protein